jgi:hypothetical protein
MISEKKRLQIANICYANVAGEFAMFTNPKYRASNFTWDWFIRHCEKNADLWMFVNNVRGKKDEIDEMARQFAVEIAENLVDKVTQ